MIMTPDEPKQDAEVGPPTWDRVRSARWAARGFALAGLILMAFRAHGQTPSYAWGIGCFVTAFVVTTWLGRRGLFRLTGRPLPPGIILPIAGLALVIQLAPTVIQCAALGTLSGFVARAGFLSRSAFGV